MVHGSSVRYEKLRSECPESGEEQGSDKDSEKEDNEVTVYLYPLSSQERIRQKKRDTWIRIAAAVVLLTVAIGFVFYELYGCLEPDSDSHNHTAPAVDHWNSEKKESHDHYHDGGDHHHEDEESPEHHSHSREGTDNSGEYEHDHHHSSMYHHGVLITDSAVCSEVGRGILVDGGNVVDAGIASLLCLGVVHPHTAGVGGVFSAILFNATSGTSKAIHSVCPETSSSTYNIPTVLQGLKLLHENFGHLSWAKLFDSAIRLAKNGFSIDETLASALKSDMEKIKSDLCDLFCHKNGSIKGQGSKVTNQKLSELLQTVSVLMENNSHFSETLGMKLAEDLPQTEKPDFVKNVQRCKGEINDPFTVKKDKYTVFTAAPPVFGGIISDILKRAGEHNLSLQSIADLNSRASSYINLLNAAKLIYSNSLAMEHQSPGDLFALNTVGSHIGVLDSSGNVLIISASLNSSFGLKQFLPSTGVILNDFTVHSAPNMLSWNCLSVLKFQDDDEIIGIGVTGGKSVPYLVTQIIINKVHYKMSFQEAVRGPFFHLEMTNPKLFSTYISGISNTSDIFKLLIDKEPQIKTMDETGEDFLALILDSYAGHVGAFGIPPANAHSDGY